MSLDLEFEHEQVAIVGDPETGVRAVVAVHSTALGPAMGGLRLRAYPHLTDAVDDALRLSRAMSMKNALAGLDLGGGKMVLLDDGGWAEPAERARRMQAVGRIVETFGGSYITAEDVGTSPADMDEIARQTPWVAGRPPSSGGRGDPSTATASTVFGAIRDAARVRLGAENLDGVTVGVQGAGHVGSRLVEMLRDAGAEVEVTDVFPSRAKEVAVRTGARAIPSVGFLNRPVDVLAPCAFGEVIAPESVAQLRCAVIAGAANNQLTVSIVALALNARSILYVPDFLANCGGIIHVGAEPLALSQERVDELIAEAVTRTGRILDDAVEAGQLPLELALELATERIGRHTTTQGERSVAMAL